MSADAPPAPRVRVSVTCSRCRADLDRGPLAWTCSACLLVWSAADIRRQLAHTLTVGVHDLHTEIAETDLPAMELDAAIAVSAGRLPAPSSEVARQVEALAAAARMVQRVPGASLSIVQVMAMPDGAVQQQLWGEVTRRAALRLELEALGGQDGVVWGRIRGTDAQLVARLRLEGGDG